jgi:hypothetical protein
MVDVVCQFVAAEILKLKARGESLLKRQRYRIGRLNKTDTLLCHLTYGVGPPTNSVSFFAGQKLTNDIFLVVAAGAVVTIIYA